MNHFGKIAEKLEEYGLDAMLLTGEANRFYASGFHSTGTDGVALVTKNKNYYFTDSRYIEAAARYVQDAEIGLTGAGRGYGVLLQEVISAENLQCVGFEDAYITVQEHGHYAKALSCGLKPATQLMTALRSVKDSEELECMIAAQRIAERALEAIMEEVRPGVT